jgi:hypothetical protein
VTFGDYWLLQAKDRGSAKARAAFVDWFLGEMQRIALNDGGTQGGTSNVVDQVEGGNASCTA